MVEEFVSIANTVNEEEEKISQTPKEQQLVNSYKEVFRRYAVGDWMSYEFGLQLEGQNIKIEIKTKPPNFNDVTIIFDDQCYDTRKIHDDLNSTPFEFLYQPFGWFIQLGYKFKEDQNDTQ